MGGRGSGGGKGGGGQGAAKKIPTGEGITDKNELINLYNSISGNSNLSVEQRVKAMHDIEERIKELDAKKLFLYGFKEMLKRLEPKEILIYGNRLTELDEYKNVRWFEPYMNKFNDIKKKGH